MNPTEEQLKNRNLAVANINAGLPQDTGVTTSVPISVSSLTTSEIPFAVTTPTITPVPDISKLDTTTTPLQPLEQETSLSDLIKRTTALQDSLIGKPIYQAEQEKTLGLPVLQQTQQDLSARLKAIQNEALAIPLQLQEQFVGRGVTTGGLAPIQAGALRQNAIQALGISSLLEASRGNLGLAQDQAMKAVALKYDPIEAQIKANLANLDLLSKDPTLTLAQKNRLDAQTAIQTKKAEEAALARKNKEGANVEALKYAGIADQLTLDAMGKAKSALEVVGIAASKGLVTPEQAKATAELAYKNAQTEKEKAEARKVLVEIKAKEGVLKKDELQISPYQKERAFRTIQSVNELSGEAKRNPQIFGRTAALPIPGFLRSAAFRNFDAELNTLKSSIAFGELTAMREASKTGGALGQVSDREGKLLESALGALDMTQSPENFVKQLEKINASITRWQQAVQSVGVTERGLITAPDGNLVEIID